MKISLLSAVLVAFLSISCTNSDSVSEAKKLDSTYNNSESTLEKPLTSAERLEKWGADDYGMKQYVMAFLKRGPNRPTDSTKAAQLQAAHLANINRMAEEGKLVLAGPFMDDGDIRGIYVFDVKTVDEARALTETDPAIQEGSLVMELHPWYGSGALMELGEILKEVETKGF